MNINATDSSARLNVTLNQSFDEYELLVDNLGPRYRSHTETWVLTVLYCAIFLTGVVGNGSTCIVIIKNGYMHTATNYYLFSLAVSDLLTLILGLPPELYGIWEAYPWRLGQPFCQFKSFVTEMTSTASVLTITSFTVERYVAICHPLRSHTMSNLSRAIKIIICIWIVSALVVLPVPLHLETFYAVTVPYEIADSLVCSVPGKWLAHKMNYYFVCSTIILFLLPMAIITALYILIGLALRRSGLAQQCTEGSGTTTPTRYKQKFLQALVVIAFFICWAPFHAQRLMTVLIDRNAWTHLLLEIQSQLFYVSGILWFVGSTVNPLLYNLMSRKYRQAFKHTLCCCCFKSRQMDFAAQFSMKRFTSQRSDTYLTSSGPIDNQYFAQALGGAAYLAMTSKRKLDLKDNTWDGGEDYEEKSTDQIACHEVSESPSYSPEVTLLADRIRDEMELETLIILNKREEINSMNDLEKSDIE